MLVYRYRYITKRHAPFPAGYFCFTAFGSNAQGAASSFLATDRSVFCSTGDSFVVTLLSNANLATSL